MAKPAAQVPKPGLASFERQRGVIEGKTFTFEPLPPANHLLDSPLQVGDLPFPLTAANRWVGKLAGYLIRKGLRKSTLEQRSGWRYLDTLAETLDIVRASPSLPKSGQRTEVSFPHARFRHPYHLRPAFDLLAELGEDMDQERRMLDAVLTVTLRRYLTELALQLPTPLKFHEQAQEYFYVGYKLEKMLPKVIIDEDRFLSIQDVYDKYYHARNYYYFSLVAREKLSSSNQLFMYYCNAVFFSARLDWGGTLQDLPQPKLLPDRNRILFFALRDPSVLHQFKVDPEYKAQLKNVLRSFPEAIVRKPTTKNKKVKKS
ncbi:conserved hypothetical protein [uncultured Gammaproteobacteria bacterium]